MFVENKSNPQIVEFVPKIYQFAGKFNPIIHLYQDNQIIGFLKYLEYNDNCIGIEYIAIKTTYLKQGNAQKLIKQLFKKYPNSLISLEVRISNISAINLYLKLGFEVVRKLKNYYQNPVEDGYLMQIKTP